MVSEVSGSSGPEQQGAAAGPGPVPREEEAARGLQGAAAGQFEKPPKKNASGRESPQQKLTAARNMTRPGPGPAAAA